MKQVLPFLHFDGNCREAMEFYKQCLGAELFLMPYSDAPGNPEWVTPESHDRIMHSTLNGGSEERRPPDRPMACLRRCNQRRAMRWCRL